MVRANEYAGIDFLEGSPVVQVVAEAAARNHADALGHEHGLTPR
jgi:hypothetical protein